MSAMGIPQLSLVCGPCTAGGAYIPAMSDETIIVKGIGNIFLGGPPLVKAATGEDVDEEELGGAEVHCTQSGVADHFVSTEEEGCEKMRHIVGTLGSRVSSFRKENLMPIAEPLYPAEEIYGILPRESKVAYDMRDILARLVDGSEFAEFKSKYAPTLLCGFARWHGRLVGIVANNGILFGESALKGTHFIQLCGRRKIPLVFLQNITGFMVGKKYEAEGIAKHGAKMVMAVATVPVPKITVIVGGSFGAGNYGMCGRAYDPRFLWTWPNSRISVMGGEQASKVLSAVKGGSISVKERKRFEQAIVDKYEKEGNPYYATARLWDDGIIDPLQTRHLVGLALSTSLNKPIGEVNFGTFRT